jgi:hypothetical protein
VICNSCKDAADLENPELHELCRNNDTEEGDASWCDCQHRIAPTDEIIQPQHLRDRLDYVIKGYN